jgi:hypothetical protein
MKMWPLSTAELTVKLRTARGAKRRKILHELQRRYDETVPRHAVVHLDSGELNFSVSSVLIFSFDIPRYNFELQHGL